MTGSPAARKDKPAEQPIKSYRTILEQQISAGEEELRRTSRALLLSGFTAGLDVGFGPFAMAVFQSLTEPVLSQPIRSLLSANFYAAGFIFVVLGHSALFTEQTTSAVQPVLAGRVGWASLFRLWGLVLVANLAGGTVFSWYGSILGPALGIVDPAVFGQIARKMVAPPFWIMFLSAIGAGWLMGLLSWITTAARDTISQIVIVWLITLIIGLTGLHHSIAGTVEVLQGLFVGQGATGWEFVEFLVAAVLGNAVGGVVMVAVLKFSHARPPA